MNESSRLSHVSPACEGELEQSHVCVSGATRSRDVLNVQFLPRSLCLFAIIGP